MVLHKSVKINLKEANLSIETEKFIILQIGTFFCILYLLWFAAIWFHMTHGIWSAFQTLGWNNNTWICRWKTISYIVATILMLMFAFTVVFFYVGNCIGLFA